MNITFFFTLIILLAKATLSPAQGKKDVKRNKIKSITEFTTIVENDKPITYKEQYTTFNKTGEILEETQFNKDGSIKKRETTKYDKNGNKIEETFFLPTDIKLKKNCKLTYRYNVNNDKIEENEFDSNTGKLLRRQVCSYNNKGDRITEEAFDENNKPVKKITYTYDNKGLKTEKKIFNPNNNVLESTKKYVYEF